MCMGGGGGVSSKDQVMQNQQAKMSNELFADYDARYRSKVEAPVMGYLMDDSTYNQNAQAAGDRSVASFDRAQDINNENMKRYGMNLTPAQQAAMDNNTALSRSETVTGEMNRSRANEYDTKTNLTKGMINVGRNSLAQSQGMMQQAAGLEHDRGIRNAQAREAARQDTINTALQVGGTAATLMLSDKNKKRDISKMDTKKALNDVKGMDLKNWRYKPGEGVDQRMHRGSMAQDAPDSITNKSKTAIDLHDELQLALGGMQELAKRVDRMERARA